MQAIMETSFDIVYLVTVLTLGIKMLRQCGGRAQFRLFGAMAVVLGAGDAFHRCPGRWRCAPPGWKTSPWPWARANGSRPSP